MRVIALVKFVPDAQFKRCFTAENTVDRSESILSELDEYAIEEALTCKENLEGKVETIALTMGPAKAAQAVKKALQMGIDRAFHLCDDALAHADAPGTAAALAAAVRYIRENIGEIDVVFTGMASTDAETTLIPSMVAEYLHWPQLTLVSQVDFDSTHITAYRELHHRREKIKANVPAVISVTDQINTPRYPSFKGILAAKNKEIHTLSVKDLSFNPSSPWSKVIDIVPTAEREPGKTLVDTGDAGIKLVDFLEEKHLL